MGSPDARTLNRGSSGWSSSELVPSLSLLGPSPSDPAFFWRAATTLATLSLKSVVGRAVPALGYLEDCGRPRAAARRSSNSLFSNSCTDVNSIMASCLPNIWSDRVRKN